MEGPGNLATAIGAFLAAASCALFVAGETALNALPESRLQALAEDEDSPFARYAKSSAAIVSRWLVCRVVLIGIAAAGFDRTFRAAGQERFAPLLAVLATALSYGAATEILAAVARLRPQSVGAAALRWLRPFELAAIPLAVPLAALGRLVTMGIRSDGSESRITETEVEWVVSQGQRSGALDREPAEIIKNVLEFGDRVAGEVMVPRTKVSAIDVSMDIAKVVDLVNADGHSRYPVYKESLDQVVGFLYAKDLFREVQTKRNVALKDILRTPVLFVASNQSVASILREMRARRFHMAVVSDEFGGTAGVITLEDIIEEIVGDIRDEYDTEAPIDELPDGRILADAAVPISDLATHLKREITIDGDFESVGGLVLHLAGTVPKVGAVLRKDGLRFVVREADETRVVKVEIKVEGTETPEPPKTSPDDHAGESI
jgi:CBS domain containing-hemolysin-like protein